MSNLPLVQRVPQAPMRISNDPSLNFHFSRYVDDSVSCWRTRTVLVCCARWIARSALSCTGYRQQGKSLPLNIYICEWTPNDLRFIVLGHVLHDVRTSPSTSGPHQVFCYFNFMKFLSPKTKKRIFAVCSDLVNDSWHTNEQIIFSISTNLRRSRVGLLTRESGVRKINNKFYL